MTRVDDGVVRRCGGVSAASSTIDCAGRGLAVFRSQAGRQRGGAVYSISSRLLPPVRLPQMSSGITGRKKRIPTAVKIPVNP